MFKQEHVLNEVMYYIDKLLKNVTEELTGTKPPHLETVA